MASQIPPGLQEAIEKTADKKSSGPRKDSIYTKEERLILDKHKIDYVAKMTRDERESYFRTRILVNIFKHWYDTGEVDESISDDDLAERIKKLSRWITNNWRRKHRVSKPVANRKTSTIDIVWRELKEKVIDEMRTMVITDGEDRELTAPELFTNRTTACKHVFDSLSPDEKLHILHLAQVAGIAPNPPDIQRKRADRLATTTISNTASKIWKDMGILCVIIYAYHKPNGQMQIGIHDKMALNSGSNKPLFIDTYRDETLFLQKKMFEYIKSLNEVSTSTDSKPIPDIEFDNGFPLMPFLSMQLDAKKDVLEALLRTYLNAHYKLASGMRKLHIPFTKLIENPDDFIEAQYYPSDLIWKDPRNMTKLGILHFCHYIRARQDQYGPNDAFRFRQYHDGKEMVIAEYGTEVQISKKRNRKGKVNKGNKIQSSRKKGKQKQVSSAVELDDFSGSERSERSIDALPSKNKGKQKQASSAVDTEVDLSNIDPLLRPNINEVQNHLVSINEMQMRRLQEKGFPSIPPINGPMDGPPHYQIPQSVLRVLEDKSDASDEGPRKRPKRKKVHWSAHNDNESQVDDGQSNRRLRSQTTNPLSGRNLRSREKKTKAAKKKRR